MSTEDEQQDSPDGDATEAPAAAGDASAETPGTEVATATATAPVPAAAPVPAVDVAASPPDSFRTRLLMPIVLPVASIFVVVLVALNISRLFLAGGEEQGPAVIVATVITVGILVAAAALSAARHVRTSSLVLGLSLVLVLVLSAGLISFGSGEAEKEEASAAPTGPPVTSFEVDALPSLAFQATEFDTVAGINQIEYIDKGGTHTLVFSDPTLDYFNLAVPQGPTKGKVELEPGRDYDIYCTIAGHRAAGMEAVVHVGAAPPPADGAVDTTTTVPAG